MRKVSLFLPLLAIPAVSWPQTGTTLSARQQSVNYDIAFPNAAQHEARVIATFSGIPRGRALHARMSRSSPGRYAETAFSRNVYDLSATDGRARALLVSRPDPDGWDVTGHDGTVRVSYNVWGDRIHGHYLSID